MKKIAIISLSALLLAACSTTSYDNEVSTQTYQEEYQNDEIAQPISESDAASLEEDITVSANTETSSQANEMETSSVEVSDTQQNITQPDTGHYLVQVVSLQNQQNLATVASGLPEQQPKWENSKTINGQEWFSLLFGNFATEEEAKAAIEELPAAYQKMNPFVKSVDTIQSSQYPTLNKLP